jgi:hypothetical protein
MPTQSRPVVRPSITDIKSSKADTFETITEVDGGLGGDNKTVFTTTWRLDYDGRRVHFLKSRMDNGQQVDVVMQWMVRMSHRREQARVAKEVFRKARNTRMYGDIEKDMLFLAIAESDESDEPYLRLFAHKEDADLWIMLSKLDGEAEALRLVSVEPIKPREARAQFFEREKTPTVINSARESSLKVQHDLFLLVLDVKRGEAAKKDLKAIGATEEQTNRVWKNIIGED